MVRLYVPVLSLGHHLHCEAWPEGACWCCLLVSTLTASHGLLVQIVCNDMATRSKLALQVTARPRMLVLAQGTLYHIACTARHGQIACTAGVASWSSLAQRGIHMAQSLLNKAWQECVYCVGLRSSLASRARHAASLCLAW